jgi:hypothetical protein
MKCDDRAPPISDEPLLEDETTRPFILSVATAKRVQFEVLGAAIFAGLSKAQINAMSPDALNRMFAPKTKLKSFALGEVARRK